MVQKETNNADNNTETNKSIISRLDKIKPIYKVFIIAVLGVGVALGCCDIDCLMFNLNSFLGL